MPTIALLNQSGEKIKDLELSELTKTTEQLNQSAQKLVEGSIQLLAGCTTYGQYLHTYMSNVSKVSEGANALLEGSKQYDASTQALIKNLISSMNNPTELIQSKINNIDLTDEQRIAVNKAISEGVQESLIQNKKSLEQLSQLLSQSLVSKQLETLSSSLSELSQAGNELSQQYQTLVTGAKSLSEGMRLFDQGGIQKITDITTIKKLKEKTIIVVYQETISQILNSSLRRISRTLHSQGSFHFYQL